jgi:hypothetical protein
MQRKYFFLKVIAFILIHSFLLFDASWAGGFQRHGAGSGTCLNAQLRIAEQSLTASFAKMLQAAEVAVPSPSERVYAGLLPSTPAVAAIRESVASFFCEIADAIQQMTFWEWVVCGFFLAVAVILFLSDIWREGDKKVTSKQVQRSPREKSVPPTRIDYKEAQFRADFAEVILLLKKKAADRSRPEIKLLDSEVEILRNGIRAIEADGRYQYLNIAFIIGYEFLTAQETNPKRVEIVLGIARGIAQWYKEVRRKGYSTKLLDDYLQRLESRRIDTPEKMKKFGALIDKGIELVKSGKVKSVKTRSTGKYPAAQTRSCEPAIRIIGKITLNEAILRAI